jgi:two-component system cell cycle response regulator
MKILLAEDDVTSRTMLTAILKKWGYETIACEDGNVAWAELQKPEAPRLVLLDWNMPGLEGLEICRQLRKKETTNPSYIIMLTGRSEKGDIVQGLEAGANDYIAKPYDNAELQARIRVGQRMLDLQSSLLETQAALAFQASHDALTGIFNRRAIIEQLTRELARALRQGNTLSVGMCDIDHFKKINDSFGHQTGDEVLVACARCLQAGLREYDYVGRYGGEEFLVITTGLSGQSDAGLYERLREQVAAVAIKTRAAGDVSITISIGTATASGQSTVDRLIAAADKALYLAKAEGRNRVVRSSSNHPPTIGGSDLTVPAGDEE